MSSSTERRPASAWRRLPMRLPLALAVSVWLHAALVVVWLDWAPASLPGAAVVSAVIAPVAIKNESAPVLRIRLLNPPTENVSVVSPEVEKPMDPLAEPPSRRSSPQAVPEPASQHTSSGKPDAGVDTLPAVSSAISELDGFGRMTGRFLERSELNRFPVLKSPIRFDTSGLRPEDLGWGHADLWLYISAKGRVVAVRVDGNSLSPAALKVAFHGVREASFMPGYVNGRPVAAKIKWRVMVTAEGDVQGAAGPPS
ncbi:MAG: hypothetical protein Q8K34_16925 [Hydrogenophaga sp.]|nr:hypothetical protein [Hydrogenophaga sp.]MDP1893123.1 hypothetical protein [Hydrogenophaga sp.]MDP2221851.1 hypothetical protein [Hydrogenophaga sp.]MDZ4238735.1 hypothetical protein [Hydrogenophaga sp.]